jgi:hypothetical protein
VGAYVSLCRTPGHEDLQGPTFTERFGGGSASCPQSPSQGTKNLVRYPCKNNLNDVALKPNKTTFHLNAIIDGHLIVGSVDFSPAPERGILTELAKFEAERLLTHLVREEIAHGRL